MDDIQGYSHHFPRLRGDTGLGVALRCLQRRGWARASAWQGRGWVSNHERWAWVTHPLGWGPGVLQAARAERRSTVCRLLVAMGNNRFVLCKGQPLEVMNLLEHSMVCREDQS